MAGTTGGVGATGGWLLVVTETHSNVGNCSCGGVPACVTFDLLTVPHHHAPWVGFRPGMTLTITFIISCSHAQVGMALVTSYSCCFSSSLDYEKALSYNLREKKEEKKKEKVNTEIQEKHSDVKTDNLTAEFAIDMSV